MLTSPSLASAMPVPEPVAPEVIVTDGSAVLYAVCQVPNSGNSSVLPVSEIDLPLALAAGGADDADEEGVLEPLLPQAAASRVSGTSAAAVHTKRIRLATEEYSFTYARLRVRLVRLARGACDEGPRSRAVLCPRAGGVLVLAEAAADVVSGLLSSGVFEDLLGVAVLDQVPLIQEDRAVGDPAGLGQVVGHDDHGDVGHQGLDQCLDRFGRERVERRRGLVEQQHLGADRQRP